jgi:hypothetical protein
MSAPARSPAGSGRPFRARRPRCLAGLRRGRPDDIERRNEHATAIEQLSQGQMKIAQFADSLATQYGQFLKALSNRHAVEKEAFGPDYHQQPSTPPLN